MSRAAFYATVRERLEPLKQSQVEGFEAILDAMRAANLPLSHRAYILATIWHEVGGTMQPIPERGGNSYFTRMYDPTGERPDLSKSMGNTTKGDGIKYRGRGLVQITWKTNYRKADAKLAAAGMIVPGELVADPDLALRLDIAVFIAVRGMVEGWFSGKKLSDYLPASGVATRAQYMAARRIINGADRADLIEDYAQIFERALRDAGLN